jgi:hypothetical protein
MMSVRTTIHLQNPSDEMSAYAGKLFPFVYLSAIAYAHDKYAQSLILNSTDDAVVAYAIFPELAQAGAFQGFPDVARIVQMTNTLI